MFFTALLWFGGGFIGAGIVMTAPVFIEVYKVEKERQKRKDEAREKYQTEFMRRYG